MMWTMSGRRSDAYRRNNAVATAHLQMAGHASARTEGWGGGTEGVVVPLETGHQLEVGQHPDIRDGSWHMRVVRHPDDPGYEQEGLHLGRTQMNRVPSPGPENRQPRDDEFNAAVTSHPRDLPGHVDAFLKHPQVRAALRNDMEKMKTERKMPGPLGDQFKPQGD
jgi:hypothetical protein